MPNTPGCKGVIYNRSQLLSLYVTTPPTAPVVDILRSLDLWTVCRVRFTNHGLALRPYRGRRSGQPRRITPVLRSLENGAWIVVANRRQPAPRRPSRRTIASLLHIDCHVDSCDQTPTPFKKVGVFNARSVGNKSASVCDWIANNSFHLAAIVETWHDGNDSPSLVACTPPGYRYVERARPRSDENVLGTNHGGVCLFHTDNLHVRPVPLPVYDSFEHLCVYVQGSGTNTLVIVVYRPGGAAINKDFFESFVDLLERTAAYKSLLILGDLNIHLDIPTNPHTITFNHTMSDFGLTQHINCSTHNGGHLLDVFITRCDVTMRSMVVDPPSLSDHSFIVAEVNLPTRTPPDATRCLRRQWRSFNIDDFIGDIEQSSLVQSPPSDVAEMFMSYDTTLRSILDKHAPFKAVRLRSSGSSVRWYNAECRSVKAKTRRLERIYRRTRTQVSLAIWRQQLALQRTVLERCFTSYWTDTINDNKHDSRALWSQVNTLLKPPPSPKPRHLSADDFGTYFLSKIDGIRAATASAPAPDIEARTIPILRNFLPATIKEISDIVNKSPPKHCDLDPLPTWLFKKAISVLAPVLCHLCNASLSAGVLPTSQKHAIVRPILKKPTLDVDDLSSYRPISNLSFISKTVERVVAARLLHHVDSHQLLPDRQSAYRRFHSTETAIAVVHNDLVVAADADHISALVLLDLSSAFDTVDHQTLLSVLQRRFGIDGVVLRWFNSYLCERSQTFSVNGLSSSNRPVTCSVPQGSVLGPLEFIMYTEDVTRIFDRYSLRHHLFADDKQAYTSAAPSAVDDIRDRLHRCVADISSWCSSRRLQLNESKTELAWFGKRSRLAKLADVDSSVTVGTSTIHSTTVVRDLGVLLDSELTMKKHVNKVTSTCFYQLRRLRQIRRLVGQDLTAQLVHAFVLSRLDYGNSSLAGLPMSTIAPLQRVQNAAARLIIIGPRDNLPP